MPFKPNISNNKGGFVKLSFDNLKIDPNVKYFYDFICNIENYLKNEIINTNIVNFKNINTTRNNNISLELSFSKNYYSFLLIFYL